MNADELLDSLRDDAEGVSTFGLCCVAVGVASRQVGRSRLSTGGERPVESRIGDGRFDGPQRNGPAGPLNQAQPLNSALPPPPAAVAGQAGSHQTLSGRRG